MGPISWDTASNILMPLLLSPASPTPSPDILDFLAHLSPPLSPDSPPAPAFLCPSCQRPELSSARRRRRQSPTSSSFPNPTVTPLERSQHFSEQFPHHNRVKTSNEYDNPRLNAVPPKYVQSSDGYWYLATSWSLHGQTSKPTLLSTPTSTPPPTSLTFNPSNVVTPTESVHQNDSNFGDDDDDDDDDDNISQLPTSFSPVDSAVVSDYEALKDSLPTGWTLPPQRTRFYSTPVIVVVSLILAISLSLIIAGCVLGHKAKSDSHRQPFRRFLNEAKSRANAQKNFLRASSPISVLDVDKESGDPGLETISDFERTEKISKHIKRKEKLWDKWRNKSGKLSDLGLRRRKKKTGLSNNVIIADSILSRETIEPVSYPISVSHDDAFHPSTSSVASTALPPALSTSALSGQSRSIPNTPTPQDTTLQMQPPPPSSLSLTASTDASVFMSAQPISLRQPPAYRHDTVIAVSNRGTASSSQVIHNESIDAVDDTDVNFGPPFDQSLDARKVLEEYSPPPPSLLSSAIGLLHRAHVATDDKTVLEMMRKGASEPRQNDDDGHALLSTSPSDVPGQLDPVRPNAPVWVDESLEHFEEFNDSSEYQDRDVKAPSNGNSSHFPPPPSPDLHRRLESHYNVDAVLLPLSSAQSSKQTLPRSLYAQKPSLLDSDGISLSSSLILLDPSTPPDDGDEGSCLRPSAPPLLSHFVESDTAEEEEETEQSDDERRSRWDRGMDMDASLARPRSTPGSAVITSCNTPPSLTQPPQCRRSLSISSLVNSNPNKRLSLPRYEP